VDVRLGYILSASHWGIRCLSAVSWGTSILGTHNIIKVANCDKLDAKSDWIVSYNLSVRIALLQTSKVDTFSTAQACRTHCAVVLHCVGGFGVLTRMRRHLAIRCTLPWPLRPNGGLYLPWSSWSGQPNSAIISPSVYGGCSDRRMIALSGQAWHRALLIITELYRLGFVQVVLSFRGSACGKRH
jgi:hypothetical protein